MRSKRHTTQQKFVSDEAGAIAKKGEELLLLKSLSTEKVTAILPVLRNIDGANIVLCTQENAYIESKDEKFFNLFQEYYHSFKMVDNLMEVAKTTPILKIAVFHFSSSEEFIYPKLKHLKDAYLLKVSGQNWLDISEDNANKGSALREVQQLLNISKEETMVFGDYHNDIEMLQEADFSFSMGNAHKDITEIANYATENNNDFGVERILERLVSAR